MPPPADAAGSGGTTAPIPSAVVVAADAYLARRLRPFTTTIFSTMSELAVATNSVNLGQGFPDTDGPEELKEVAVEAIRAGHNQYPPSPGVPELRRAIAAHQRDHYGLELSPTDEVLVTVGATEAIAAALLALCEPGDEVVAFEPTYDSYAACAAMAGAALRLVRLHPPDWSFDPADLAAAVGPRTRLVLLNSPHNPTGKVFSPAELAQVAALCAEHDLLAVTDEVYEHLVFEGTHVPLATMPGMASRTLTISSGGKTFSFTGWKVGWASGPAPLVAAVRSAKQFLTYTSPAAFQLAIARGLAWPPEALGGARRRAGRQARPPLSRARGARPRCPPARRHLLRHHRHRRRGAGLSALEYCLAIAPTLWRRRHPELGLLRPGGPHGGRHARAMGLLQARGRPPRCARPPSIVGVVSIPIAWVDAFSDTPFRGNPAAVCLLDDAMDEARMQSLAFELGISETAYVTPAGEPGVFDLRWFTPSVEVDLCGHATLAAAHALRHWGVATSDTTLTFHTRSGPLVAFFEDDRIALDFPAEPPVAVPLPECLRGQWPDDGVRFTGRTAFFSFVVLPTAEAVAAYVPDLAAIAATGANALLLTAAGDDSSGGHRVGRHRVGRHRGQ